MPPASRTKSYCIASPLQKRRKIVKRRADVIEERRASREELANSRRQPPGRSRRNPALFSAVHTTRNHAASAVITVVNTTCAWSENTESAAEERSGGAVRWSVHSCDRVEACSCERSAQFNWCAPIEFQQHSCLQRQSSPRKWSAETTKSHLGSAQENSGHSAGEGGTEGADEGRGNLGVRLQEEAELTQRTKIVGRRKRVGG